MPSVSHWEDRPLNIVSGHFADGRGSDWAALCILPDGTARVFVLWGDQKPCLEEISHGWPLDHPNPPDELAVYYLLAASRKQILTFRKFFGDPHTDQITHEGVEVGDEQASLIYYCHAGKWLELQGND